METMTWAELGDTLIDGINAYRQVILDAGLEFVVYTGAYFYDKNFKQYAMDCDFWVARYYNDDQRMTPYEEPDANYCPRVKNLVAWQYSSKGLVEGYSGNIDLNIYYAEFNRNVLNDKAYEVRQKK